VGPQCKSLQNALEFAEIDIVTVIVDYGMGNLGSILNMLKKIGVSARLSTDVSEIGDANKLILPGVGAFDTGMSNLSELNLINVLNKKVLEEKTPVLGICLGMQLMTKQSEEGNMAGLGWIDAEAIRFKFHGTGNNLKTPHMGWNFLNIKNEHTIFREIGKDARFYFVHSYYLVCNNAEDVLATTTYGYDFVSVINKENIFGVQFHPEKSHKFGMRLLKNFADL
jgi:glutamine amidotransferase